MATALKYPPSINAIQKTLDAQLLTGVTASVTLNNVTNIQDKTGVIVIDAVDTAGVATPAKREYIVYTGVSGSTLTTLTRNADGGGTDQDHSVGAIVQFVNDVQQQQAIIDALLLVVDTDGDLNKATGTEVNTGTDDAKIVTAKAIADSKIVFSNSLYQQALINANFTVNQRVYVSSATLADGEYGHDRWKAGASGGDYTFTQLASSTQITIEAGKSLIQVIEDKNVIGGHYTLSWTGTAQGRFGIDTATPSGAYADSGIAITTQTAGTVMSVEFDDGTLSEVVLNSGGVALPFMPKSVAQELQDCQRYYEKSGAESNGTYPTFTSGLNTTTTANYGNYYFKVPKRNNAYTLETDGTAAHYMIYHGADTATACSVVPAMAGGSAQNTKDIAYVKFTVASGLSAGTFGQGRGKNSSSSYLAFNNEL